MLDIASGVGDPAITLADCVGPEGCVIAADVRFKQVAEAKENAYEKGLVNLNFVQADAQALPFSNHIFDIVTCRFGVVFFPDVDQASKEILRVLKPGGKVSLIVWGAEEQQESQMCILQVLRKHDLTRKYDAAPSASPSKPGKYRFRDPGPLLAILEEVGFKQVNVVYHALPEIWVGTLEEYLELGGVLAVEFQSAPLTEARGDPELWGGCRPHSHVSIRSPHRSKGRYHAHIGGDVAFGVSIRSPHRSKGRSVAAAPLPAPPEKFQSAPLTEARGDLNLGSPEAPHH